MDFWISYLSVASKTLGCSYIYNCILFWHNIEQYLDLQINIPIFSIYTPTLTISRLPAFGSDTPQTRYVNKLIHIKVSGHPGESIIFDHKIGPNILGDTIHFRNSQPLFILMCIMYIQSLPFSILMISPKVIFITMRILIFINLKLFYNFLLILY